VVVAAIERKYTDPAPTSSAEERTQALLETLRAAFVRAGARESRSEAQDGFFFVDGEPGTVCLEYSASEREGPVSRIAVLRRRDVAVLNCCAELARNGYAFTLFLSPRTLALTVRSNC
jgi:hypothetical protein